MRLDFGEPASSIDSLFAGLDAFYLLPYSRLRQPAESGLQGSGNHAANSCGRAGPLVSKRVDLPEPGELKSFDPCPYLCPESQMALEQPDRLLLPKDELPPPLPKG